MALGIHGYLPTHLTNKDVNSLTNQLWQSKHICIDDKNVILFSPDNHIIFDKGEPLAEHPQRYDF